MTNATPRNLKFEFPADLPRHWIRNDILGTHMINGINLLFPAGERFFIRSVAAHSESVKDPESRKQVKAFMAQEFYHGREHERFFEVLTHQGFKVENFLRFYEKIAFGFVEKLFSSKTNLAITAAMEHFTASLADDALSDWLKSDKFHPAPANLLRWHAIEEIEHKSVAFDVMQASGVGYFRRAAGMVLAATLLSTYWMMGTLHLLRQDPDAKFKTLLRQLPESGVMRMIRRRTLSRAFFKYLKPGFHPSQIPNHELAVEALKDLRTA